MKRAFTLDPSEQPAKKQQLLKKSHSTENLLSQISKEIKEAVTKNASRTSELTQDQQTLPKDILLAIFQLLPRTSIGSVKTVCLFWFRVASHPSLSWQLFSELSFRSNTYNLSSILATLKNFSGLVIKTQVPSPFPPAAFAPPSVTVYNVLDSNLQVILRDIRPCVASTAGTAMADPVFELPPEETQKNSHLLQYDIDYAPDAPVGRFMRIGGNVNVKVSIYLNTFHIEKAIIEGSDGPFMKAITLMLCQRLEKAQHDELPSVYVPAEDSYFPSSLPALPMSFDLSRFLHVELYQYQKKAIAWMKSVETNPPKLTFLDAIPWHVFRSDIFWSEFSHVAYLYSEDILPMVKHIQFHGGVLADEMGLGKTLEVAGLLFYHQKRPSPTFQPNKLVWDPEGSSSYLFETKATLIFCPPHLIGQWKSELEKHSKKIFVKAASSVGQWKSFTYRDIAEADVILLTFQVITGPNYVFHQSNTYGTVSLDTFKTKQTQFIPTKARYLRDKLIAHECVEDIPAPTLELFLWHRIVVDEGHEIVTNEKFQAALLNFQSSSRWYVTGTPFPNQDTCIQISQFLRPDISSKHQSFTPTSQGLTSSIFQTYREIHLTNLMIEHYAWRNSKESVKTEFSVPSFTEEVLLLEFHPIERAFYTDALLRGDEERQRQLSNSPHLSSKERKIFGNSSGTLDQMRVKMIDYLKERPARYQKKIDESLKTIKTTQTEIQELKNRLGPDIHVGTDDELSDDEEAKQKRKQNLLKEVHELTHGKAQKEKKEKVVKSEQQKKEEAVIAADKREKKDHKRTIFELRAKKRKLRSVKATLHRYQEKVQIRNSIVWNAQSLDHFNAIESNPTYLHSTARSLDSFEKPKTYKPKTIASSYGTKKKRKSTGREGFTAKNLNSHRKNVLANECKRRGLDHLGSKADLVKRLLVPIQAEETKAKQEQSKQWKDELEEDLVQALGTKLASTVQFLKRLLYGRGPQEKQAKILIFSQFSAFLHKVGNFLQANGIDNLFIEGAVNTKQSAITKFKSGEVQVMMLSLGQAASGTNLTEATHVILLDPIQGTLDEAKAIEDQAIGRAYRQGQQESVTVVRLLIKDTIEHAQYLQRLNLKKLQKEDEMSTEETDEEIDLSDDIHVNEIMNPDHRVDRKLHLIEQRESRVIQNYGTLRRCGRVTTQSNSQPVIVPQKTAKCLCIQKSKTNNGADPPPKMPQKTDK